MVYGVSSVLCSYRLLLQLQLVIDTLEMRHLFLRERLVAEPTALSARAVVHDVEEHAPHGFRVVVVDARSYVASPPISYDCRSSPS